MKLNGKKLNTGKIPGLDLFKEFFESEKSAGYILVALTAVSILLANSSYGYDYQKIWKTYVDLSFFGIELKYSIEHWINDGLMAVFFLLIGLEIEREIYTGELSSPKKSSLPLIAALGGMVVPAAFFMVFNFGQPTQRGFGIPMATDIAFALGILSLLGKRIPLALKIFLTALAIIDDLGAILIIAIFYTSDLHFGYLLGSLSVFTLLLILNRMNVLKLYVYLLFGLVMWYCMLKSGVHATISGVLLAFAIPFRKNDEQNISYTLQKRLHHPVAFFIIPLFALANTVIQLPDDLRASVTSNVTTGIVFGLFLGKPVGIVLFSYLGVLLGLSQLPHSVNWKLILGVSSLAGIGFTMSIFITNLAFTDVELITAGKIGIIIASTLSAIVGLLILLVVTKKKQKSS
ncbi:MAG: Na+/H+ antiporter NhaA [Bacteroidota bacterium]